MKHFSIPKTTVKRLVTRDALVTGAYYLFLLGIIFLTCFYFGKNNFSSSGRVIFISFSILFIYWFIRQLIGKRDFYKSYLITLDDVYITQSYLDTDNASFKVEKVKKTDKGGLYVSGGGITIYVLPYVENIGDLEQLLPGVDKTVSYREYTGLLRQLEKYPFLLMATLIVCFIMGNKSIMSMSALLLFFIWGYTFYIIQFSGNYNQREKGWSYVILLFILLLIALWCDAFFNKPLVKQFSTENLTGHASHPYIFRNLSPTK